MEYIIIARIAGSEHYAMPIQEAMTKDVAYQHIATGMEGYELLRIVPFTASAKVLAALNGGDQHKVYDVKMEITKAITSRIPKEWHGKNVEIFIGKESREIQIMIDGKIL